MYKDKLDEFCRVHNIGGKERILLELCIESEYESEYDGRTYIYCKHCDKQGGCEEDHEDYCLTIRARKLMGKTWESLKSYKTLGQVRREKVEAERIAIERKIMEEQKLRNTPVACDRCGKVVSQQGLTSHQQSNSCKRRAERLKEQEK